MYAPINTHLMAFQNWFGILSGLSQINVSMHELQIVQARSLA